MSTPPSANDAASAPGAAGTPSPAESPSLERHQVRVGFSEPASPSLARRPDGTPLRAERSPTPTEPAAAGQRRRPAAAAAAEASEPVSVTSFAGVPRWAHRAEVWAPGAPGNAGGDPQHKQSSQFDEHIHQLRDEQERVQKKTFLNWINSHLKRHDPPMQMTNLIDDLKDSTRLVALLNVLSGQDLPVERGRVLKTPHFLSNANTALRFLQSRNIKLVNINPSDIVDGRPPVILGLIWTIILHFQIEMNTRALEQLAWSGSVGSLDSRGSGSESAPAATAAADAPTSEPNPAPQPPGARKALLSWARNATKAYGLEVKDFGPSWRDGRAFVAVVHCIEPNAIDVSATERQPAVQRLDTAFKVAENDLGITRLLDPEDVDVASPDEKSVMTYVAQFLHKYPKPKTLDPPANGGPCPPEQEVMEISVWIIRTIRVVQTIRPPEKDDFTRFQTIRTEATEKHLRYVQLKTLTTSVTEETWQRVDEDWRALETQLTDWQTFLDSRLPKPLQGVAQWVNKAESVLDAAADPPVAGRRASELVTVILEEHTVLVECPT